MGIRPTAVMLVAFIAACETAPDPVEPDLEAAPQAVSKVGPGVVDAINSDGHARVMIALASPMTAPEPGASGLPLTVARSQRVVDRIQAEVLDGIDDQAFTVRHRYAMVPALAGALTSEAALATLADDPNVLRVDLDVGGIGMLGTSVSVIAADQRHASGNDGEGVIVAVLDTGADSNHPDLQDDVIMAGQACFGDNNFRLDGIGFCPNGSDRQVGPGAAEDDAGHGTHVSGIISSNGASSAMGAAPGAGILPIKVMDNCNLAGCFYNFAEVVAALDYVITNNATLGVQVINMSLGTFALFNGNCDNAASFTMAGAAAINTLRAMGVIAFASAGNNGSTTRMSVPACLSNVMSVGASNDNDSAAGFTNSNTTTDIFAPGVGIASSRFGGGTIILSGTSMASPHAAGCAALLIQAGDATTPAQLEARLETSPVAITRGGLSFPRIDCGADGPPPNTPPTASAGGPYTGAEGAAIELSGATVFDADGDPLVVSWEIDTVLCEFSDAAALSPTLTCTDDGAFTATLTVDDGTDVATSASSVTVNNIAPIINSFSVAPLTVLVGLGVDASGTFSDVPADVLTASVEWGDGVATAVGSPFAETHTYLTAGTLMVRLTVTDDDGGVSMRSIFVDVLTPAQAIEALITTVDALDLPKNRSKSFVAILGNALRSVNRGQDAAALGQLNAFVNQVNAQRGKAIASSHADALVATAQRIIGAIEARMG